VWEPSERAILRRDVATLVAVRAAIALVVFALGFRHVSDDDYARVVIAQGFAASPKLDPSGTSWLPFPFWVAGGSMLVFGRSIAVARAATFAVGAIATAAFYLALRGIGVRRGAALLACVIAMATPWNAWLAASVVPEAFTASLIAVACVTLAGPPHLLRLGAVSIFVASLSRYEAWPVAFGLALVASFRAARTTVPRPERRIGAAAAALALAGPCFWMAWNHAAHGSATHFLDRVASYRKALGAAAHPLSAKLFDYPKALLATCPWTLALACVALVALRDREVRRRWALPLASGATMLAFLIYGDVRDGAPTHHPERPLLAFTWLLAAFGLDGAFTQIRTLASSRPRGAAAFVAALAGLGALFVTDAVRAVPSPPGEDAASARDAQLAAGEALRRAGATRVRVTPCAYEHFALIAAYERPEWVDIDQAKPATAAETRAREPAAEARSREPAAEREVEGHADASASASCPRVFATYTRAP
jgi:hypothetical protein